MRIVRLSSITAVFSALVACGGTTAPATSFGATLSAAAEVPANSSAATGAATLMVNGTSVTYSITYSGLSGNPTGSHIHVGVGTVSGPVVVPFSGLPAATSGTISGSFTQADIKVQASPPIATLDDLLAHMRAGNTYVNIHTAANAGGEIRGQVAAK